MGTHATFVRRPKPLVWNWVGFWVGRKAERSSEFGFVQHDRRACVIGLHQARRTASLRLEDRSGYGC